jgi:hypothetical protein
MCRDIRPETLLSMEAHVALLEKIYEDAFHTKTREQNASTLHLKLIAHVRQQLSEREATLAELQSSLALAEQVLHEKEVLAQEIRRALELLQQEHTNLRQAPLVKLHELLTRLFTES